MFLDFIKRNFTNGVLLIIAVCLLLLAVQSVGTVSLRSSIEVESFLQIVRELATWAMLFSLVGVLGYVAINGGNTDAAVKRLDEFQKSDQFTSLERSFENAPVHVKKLAEAGQQLITLANALIDSPALDKLEDVVKDLQDGVEEDVPEEI